MKDTCVLIKKSEHDKLLGDQSDLINKEREKQKEYFQPIINLRDKQILELKQQIEDMKKNPDPLKMDLKCFINNRILDVNSLTKGYDTVVYFESKNFKLDSQLAKQINGIGKTMFDSVLKRSNEIMIENSKKLKDEIKQDIYEEFYKKSFFEKVKILFKK